MVSYVISQKAYLKIFFHVAKHPHKQVNGVLLGSQGADSTVLIADAVPLLHHWTSLSPMMEIGLDLVRHFVMMLLGYYQACERLDDTALAPVGEKVAGKIKDGFNDAIALVIDGETIGSGAPALIPYQPQGTSWRAYSGDKPAFAPNSPFRLDNDEITKRAVTLVRESRQHEMFGDFDDHLEDVTIDWLRNLDCLPTDIGI
ncbi:hypothetical protein ONZ45_g8693 [Pleurotus djamor]|nr:hypothetical protein ONZ45_g8693 [Pleurotus djamor]